MIEVLHDPAFWTFLATAIGAWRYLMEVKYKKESSTNVEKAKLDLSVENVKSDNTSRTLDGLSKAVAQIFPTLKQHSFVMAKLEEAIGRVDAIEIRLKELMSPLNDQYASFNRIVPKMTASLQETLDEVAKIKTEVLELKKGSPNVFVTTKK